MSEFLEDTWTDLLSNYAPEYDTFSYHEYGDFTSYDHFTVPEIDYSAWVLRKESKEFEERFPLFLCCIIKKEEEGVRSFSLDFRYSEKTYTLWYGFYEHERRIAHDFNHPMSESFKPPIHDFPEAFHDISTSFIEWVESRNENRLLVITS